MVVDLSEERADRVFHALADATRRDTLVRVLEGEHNVSALARCYPVSFAAVQKHVSVLEEAGLVTKHRNGREQLVRSDVDTIRKASRRLEQLEAAWRGRIDRIGEILADEQPRRTEPMTVTSVSKDPGAPRLCSSFASLASATTAAADSARN